MERRTFSHPTKFFINSKPWDGKIREIEFLTFEDDPITKAVKQLAKQLQEKERNKMTLTEVFQMAEKSSAPLKFQYQWESKLTTTILEIEDGKITLYDKRSTGEIAPANYPIPMCFWEQVVEEVWVPCSFGDAVHLWANEIADVKCEFNGNGFIYKKDDCFFRDEDTICAVLRDEILKGQWFYKKG